MMTQRKHLCWAFLLAGIMFAGCKGAAPPSSGGTGPSPTGGATQSAVTPFVPQGMDAAKLCEGYQADQKGKEIAVHGMIHSIRPDSQGGLTLTLKGAGGGNVRCSFAADELEVAAKKLGDQINVKGTCDGKQGNADAFEVVLKGCKLMP